MLWKYAPAADMVGDRPVDGRFGAGGRHLQMGRRRRCGSLLRSVLAGCGKDRHGGILLHAPRPRRARNASTPSALAPAARLRRAASTTRNFRSASPAAEQTFFGDDVVAVHLNLNPSLRPNQSHHLALERQAAGFPAERRFVCSAALGSRHLRARRHHHRSADERIADQQQRDLLCAPAFGVVAAVAAAQVTSRVARTDARLVR